MSSVTRKTSPPAWHTPSSCGGGMGRDARDNMDAWGCCIVSQYGKA